MISSEEKLLRNLFEEALRVADPMRTVADALPERPGGGGRVLVVGAGKASARMAEAVEQAWGPCEGLVITRYGHARPTRGVEIIEAAHPVPDAAGMQASARMLDLLGGVGQGDLVVALISGGGSALLSLPVPAVSAEVKQQVNRALLESGAPIGVMNLIRKHLSQVKGGQLAAAAYPARMVSLLISDVPGDDPAQIASGPTVGERQSATDALKLIRKLDIGLAPQALTALVAGSGVLHPADKRLSRVTNHIIAAPSQSLAAAAALARGRGITVEILGDTLEGEAEQMGRDQARMAKRVQARLCPGDAPRLILSGGECTVTGRGDGIGGSNAEFALAALTELQGQEGIHLIACDTDGIDGAADVAGAVVTPETFARMRQAGIDPQDALGRHDSHGFFARVGGQVVTGPTHTNVNDFRAILVQPAPR